MHDEKIWAIDLTKNEKYMLSGGGDSTLKLWIDNTAQKELEDKEKLLQRLQDEQKLSNLIKDEDYLEAALMAFRLNKLRDFYLVLDKVIQNKTHKIDPVDSVLNDRKKFKTFLDSSLPQAQPDSNPLVSKIVVQLLKEDKKKVLELIRNLNSKNLYASLA